MSKVKQIMEQNKPTGLTMNLSPTDLQTLTQAGVIPPKTPPQQVAVFAKVCAEKGLSPFSKQIYLTSYNTKEGLKYSVITGIDGYRALAARTHLYAGCEPPMFNRSSQGVWYTAADLLISGKKAPISCTFTIYKLVGNQRVTFTAEVLFDEYASKTYKGDLMGKWKTMPFNMIAKCAEAAAYKKAFPEQMAGLTIPEEQAAWEDQNKGMTSEPIIKDEEREELLEQVRATLEGLDIQGLMRFYEENPILVTDPEIHQLLTDRKNQIQNG